MGNCNRIVPVEGRVSEARESILSEPREQANGWSSSAPSREGVSFVQGTSCSNLEPPGE